MSARRPGVNRICDLDVETYMCITPDIPEREVVITDERIAHIRDHHPGHFEEIAPYLKAAVEAPDYILEDTPHTGLILKAIAHGGLRLQMVLRIHTSTDASGFKNSILSAWKISESRWNNYLRNKKILYKSE